MTGFLAKAMNFPRLVVGLVCMLLLGSCGDGWQIQQAAKNTDSALRVEPSKEVSTNISENPYFIQVSDVHFDSSATTTNYGYVTVHRDKLIQSFSS